MASSALTEKINKIRQLNEEIKRRHEEVEEDKKNAAKQNALVQMVPSTDWPERKEPPEFTNSYKTKQKSTKEKYDYIPQSHSSEGRKIHSFAQGEGPPPDPKYNFLADSEREEPAEHPKETIPNRTSNKAIRGSFRKKVDGRENTEKNSKMTKGNYKNESQSGYDAWRAERNQIDEDRISRQRTAEGNWLREWDNDKLITHSRNNEFARDLSREHISAQYCSERLENTTFPRFSHIKKKYKDAGRKYDNKNEHVNYNQSGNNRFRGSVKNVHGNHDIRTHSTYNQHRNNAAILSKNSESPSSEERTVIATEKSIKITVNQNSLTKGPVMSIKVNSPSIAGTGRVGPRQRTRVTYSHSDVDAPASEKEHFFRQKSFEDKSKASFFNNQKFSNIKRTHSQRKKESDSKPLHYQRKEGRKEDSDTSLEKYHKNDFRSYSQKDQQKFYSTKSPKLTKRNINITKHDSPNVNGSQKYATQECLSTNEANVEYNVKIENCESLYVNETDQIEITTSENSEVNIENTVTSDLTLKKETEQTFSGTSEDTDNHEHVDKNVVQNNDFNITNLTDAISNVTENVQENNGASTENASQKEFDSEPNNGQPKDVFKLNENNNMADSVKLEENLLPKDDLLSLEQIGEECKHAHCNDSESKGIAQQIVNVVIENSISSLETGKQSVIEINNQSTGDKEFVQHQTEKANENNKSFDKISKDIICGEISPKDTLSHKDESITSTETEKEKSEEKLVDKEGL